LIIVKRIFTMAEERDGEEGNEPSQQAFRHDGLWVRMTNLWRNTPNPSFTVNPSRASETCQVVGSCHFLIILLTDGWLIGHS
jgi:hypothetical protein